MEWPQGSTLGCRCSFWTEKLLGHSGHLISMVRYYYKGSKHRYQYQSRLLGFNIKMTSNVYSHRKEERHTIHRSDYSFCSPGHDEQHTTLPKAALKQSRTQEYLRNRTELFAEEKKENENLLAIINKSYSYDFVQELRTEHRVEVQKLLLEISRLHDLLENQDRAHKHVIQRLKEDTEQMALLRISNLRQSQIGQLEIVDIQLRKTREALEEKSLELEEMEKASRRKIENLTHENESLKADLKVAIESKNDEVYKMRETYQKESEESLKKREEEANEMRELAEREMRKVQKKLREKEELMEQLKKEYEEAEDRKSSLENKFCEERIALEEKLSTVIHEQREKQLAMVANLKQFYHAENNQTQQQLQAQKDLFLVQIEELMRVIRLKDNQVQRNLIFRETEKVGLKLMVERIEEDNTELRKKLKELKLKQMEEIELLKVKMGVLHRTDIQELVRIYEAKIENLTNDMRRSREDCEKAEETLATERKKFYESKKKHDYRVARLNEDIMLLRTGMSDMEKDMKEKIDNEKSMMMLTSRSLIKEAEVKDSNVKFYEEQLRKLRQLLDIQAQEVEDSERNVEEKIKMAEDELTRLSNKILQIKGESEDAEKRFKAIIEDKDQEIKRLNKLMNVPGAIHNEHDEEDEMRRVHEQLGEKEDAIRTLQMRCEDLESQVRHLKANVEHLEIESQINSEDAKKHYKVVADKNLAEMKGFYERRLLELEGDKRDLSRINSSQSERIAELVKKYKQAEGAMRELMRQAKKRGDLESRIIELGMDNNLVKNMAEIFHK